MRASVVSACLTAAPAIRLDSCTCRPISVIDPVISSVAVATDCTLVDASVDASATMLASCWVVSALRVGVLADASSSVEADDTVSTVFMPPSDSSASFAMSALRLLARSMSARLPSSCLASASRAEFSRMTAMVLAMSPISSPRVAPGTSMSNTDSRPWPIAPLRRMIRRETPANEDDRADQDQHHDGVEGQAR